MNDAEAETWRDKEISATNYRNKLRLARERKGMSQHEAADLMAFFLGGRGAYYDIEEHEHDFTYCYSLNEIKRVCKQLDIHTRDLFCENTSVELSISEVIEIIKRHCVGTKVSISEFEDIAGWELESCLENPPKALDEWNVDCLIDVSRELKIDWRCVIAGL